MPGSQADKIRADEIAKKHHSIKWVSRVKMKFGPNIIFTQSRKRRVWRNGERKKRAAGCRQRAVWSERRNGPGRN